MQRFGRGGFRMVISALGVSLGLVLVQLSGFGRGDSDLGIVYAIEGTPTPIPVGTGVAGGPAPAAVLTGGVATATPVSGTVGAAAGVPAASPLQQTSDQIATVSQRVSQVVQDPTLAIDDKVQQINNLALQFNQLVAQWQQQLAQTPATSGAAACGAGCVQQPGSAVAGVQSTATAATVTNPGASNPSAGVVPTPGPTDVASTTAQSADQVRAQIAAVTQRMTVVSQDSSLSPDAKTAQLGALGAQFNQLMVQLQQLGG